MWAVGRALHIAVLLAIPPHLGALGGTFERVGGRAGRGGRLVAIQKLVRNEVCSSVI